MVESRIGWLGLATIWFGGVISVPALLLGALLIAGLPFGEAILWGGLGFVLVGASMAALGARAAERDADTLTLATPVFGSRGARWVVGLIVGVPLVGWFGVQTAIAAASVVRIVQLAFATSVPMPAVALALGVAMTATAVAGFSALKWFNYVAVPAKLALVAYGVAIALHERGMGPVLVWNPDPARRMDPLTAIGLAAGFLAVAAVIAPDYARQARSARAAAAGSLLGLVPAAVLLAACGAVLAVAQQTHDIVEIYARMGLPILALVMLIVATWTTNVINVYSAGLALGGLAGWGLERRALATAAAGALGAILASLGILDRLTGFLSLLTLTVLPIAGTMIAAWWWWPPPAGATPDWQWRGLLAWAIGVVGVLLIEHPVRHLLGPVIAAVAWRLLAWADLHRTTRRGTP